MKTKAQKITVAIVALITLALIVTIVICAIHNGQKEETPVVTTPQATESTTEQPEAVVTPVIENTAQPDDEDSDIPDTTDSETKDADLVIDIGEMSRNPEPEVVGGDIEYGTKE